MVSGFVSMVPALYIDCMKNVTTQCKKSSGGKKVTQGTFLSVGDGRVLYHQRQREDYPYARHAQEKLCKLTCNSCRLSACSVAGA